MCRNPGKANKFRAKLITFRAAVIIILIQPHLVPKIRRSGSKSWGGGGDNRGPSLPSSSSPALSATGAALGYPRGWGVLGGGGSLPSATNPRNLSPSPCLTPSPLGGHCRPRAVALPRCPGGGTVPSSPPNTPPHPTMASPGTGGIGRPQLACAAVMATAGLARRPHACGHAGRSSLRAVCP